MEQKLRNNDVEQVMDLLWLGLDCVSGSFRAEFPQKWMYVYLLFDASLEKARNLISLYEKNGVSRERI